MGGSLLAMSSRIRMQKLALLRADPNPGNASRYGDDKPGRRRGATDGPDAEGNATLRINPQVVAAKWHRPTAELLVLAVRGDVAEPGGRGPRPTSDGSPCGENIEARAYIAGRIVADGSHAEARGIVH